MSRVFKQYELSGEPGKLVASQIGSFKGLIPRQAATKVATRGFKLILLRESGTTKVHVFTGDCTKQLAPDTAPAWMKGRMISVPKVKKAGIIKFKHMAEILPGLPEKVTAMLGD